ncbi:hypothetical protein [Chloroflexus sp.]|uniref:hypothetical protein n=1 Tax=Chloroflexus sp. TaxID=1904827 RepID=UPI003C78E6AB
MHYRLPTRSGIVFGIISLTLLIILTPLLAWTAPTQTQVFSLSTHSYDLQITAGSTLAWRNDSSGFHRLRAIDGSWETPLMRPAKS